MSLFSSFWSCFKISLKSVFSLISTIIFCFLSIHFEKVFFIIVFNSQFFSSVKVSPFLLFLFEISLNKGFSGLFVSQYLWKHESRGALCRAFCCSSDRRDSSKSKGKRCFKVFFYCSVFLNFFIICLCYEILWYLCLLFFEWLNFEIVSKNKFERIK